MGVSSPKDGTEATANGRSRSRVVTIVTGAGVLPLSATNDPGRLDGANENRWIDRIGFRRRRFANVAAISLTLLLLWAGVWIVQEFSRLQKLAACYEAGGRNCAPLNLERRGR